MSRENTRLSQLSPDVAPFVPRKNYLVKQSHDFYDSTLPDPSNIDVIYVKFETPTRTTNAEPSSKYCRDNRHLLHPSVNSTDFKTPSTKPSTLFQLNRTGKTQNECSQRFDGELSPDVAPFVPRKNYLAKQSSDFYDSTLPDPSNVDVIYVEFETPERPTHAEPTSKYYSDNRHASHPSDTHFKAPTKPSTFFRPNRIGKTPNECSQRFDVEASAGLANDALQIPQISQSVYRNIPQTRRNVYAALEEKRSAFAKPTRHYNIHVQRDENNGARCRPPHDVNLDASGDVKTDPRLNEHRTEAPNNFFKTEINGGLGNSRMELAESNPTNSVSRVIPVRRKMRGAKLEKRSNFSQLELPYDGHNLKVCADAVFKSKVLSRTTKVGGDLMVKQPVKNLTTTIGALTTCADEKQLNAPKNVLASKSFETVETQERPAHDPSITARDSIPKNKKTEGQRKKEYKNKVKLLPSVKGKVLTVSREFYDSVTQNESRIARLLTKNNGTDEFQFGINDFPALENSIEDQNLACSFARKCAIKESPEWSLQSDSEWIDMEPSEYPSSKIGKMKRQSKPPVRAKKASVKEDRQLNEMVVSSKMDEPKLCTYAASLKKNNSLKIPPLESQDDVKESIIRTNVKGLPSKLPAKLALTHCANKSKMEPSRKPKANSLIEFNLMTMLKKNQTSCKDDYKKSAVTSTSAKKMVKVRPVIANILDSSAPSRRRGKEREKPAKRRPTAMKKIILKEREERKMVKSTSKSPQSVENDSIIPGISSILEYAQPKNKNVKNKSINSNVSINAVGVHGPAIHTRKFREYCNQMLNPEIDETVTKLIQDLIRFQDRLYQKDPIKAKMRRRLVVGLREVTKHLKLKKLKCIILAPNLEKIISNGGLDEAMNNIIFSALEQRVPFVFALGRRGLGRVCLKNVPVSSVGIFNYDGSEVNFKHLCILAMAAQEAYQEATRQGSQVEQLK